MLNKLIFTLLAAVVVSISARGQTLTGPVTVSNGIYTLKVGNTTMTINAKVGSRIDSYIVDGKEIIATSKMHPRYYGSTLWLSPEGKWKGHGILDAGEYSARIFNDGDLHLKSKDDTVKGFSFLKKFSGNTSDTSITIQYTITNISKDLQQVAPWEVTRVPTGGLAVFPKKTPQDIPSANKMYPLPATRDNLNVIWYPYDSSTESAQKLFMEGGEGWVAYVHNRVIFIKKFPAIKPVQAAPNEKNFELYVNKEKTYIELENQGRYKKLKSGKSLTYEVKWYARVLPDGLNTEIGSVALLNYIRSTIK